MIPLPDISQVYPKTGIDADIAFRSSRSFVSAGSAMFDDTNDFVNCGDHANSQMTTGDFSVAYWAKTVSTAEHFCVSKQDAGIYDGYRFGFEGGNYRCSIQVDGSNKTGDVDGNVIVNDGVWHHFAFTVDRSDNLLCYVDGQLDKTVDISSISGTIDPAEDLILGASYSGGSQNFGGNLCNVGIYKGVVLTQAQIKSIMASNSYAITAAVVTPSLYYLLAADYNDSTGAQNGTNNGSLLVGDKACLPSGLDLASNAMSAQCFTGRGIALDGSADFLYADDGGINFATAGGTFSAWVKATTVSSGIHIIVETANTYRFSIGRNAGAFFVSAYTGSGSYFGDYSTSLIVPGLWYHVVATTDGSSATVLYVNGVAYSESYASAVGISGDNGTTIGRLNADTNSYWDGSISDVKLFDVTLTAAQALELYENPETVVPSGITASDLISYFPLCDYDIVGADSLDGLPLLNAGASQATYFRSILATGGVMEFSQPVCPQFGLRDTSATTYFDGATGSVTVAADSGIDGLFSSGGSIAFWIFPFGMGDSYGMLGNSFDSGGYVLNLHTASGATCKLQFTQRFDGADATWITNSHDISFYAWNHVVITYDGSAAANDPIFYVNAVVKAATEQVAASGAIEADNGVKYIGVNNIGTREFNGYITEAAMWKNILSANEVTAIRNGGVRGFDLSVDSGNYVSGGTDLKGWWKLDRADTVADLSTFGNTATVAGAPSMVTIPESTTEDLSILGTLTSKRSGSAVLNLQQTDKANTAAVCGYAQTPVILWDATKFTIAVWVKVTATPVSGDRIINFSHGGKFVMLRMYDTGKPYLHIDGGGTTTNNPDLDIRNSWALIVIRRTAAAAFTTGARLISGGSFTSNATTPSSVVLDTTGTVDWGCQSTSSRYGVSGQIAMPKIFNGESLSDADLNSLFESGKRMLLGVS